MLLKLILPVLFAAIISCKKDLPEKSATELLTQKVWTLVSYGYDHNANGILDAAEESIRDCEKDNKYSFNANGRGLFEDNNLSCGNGISEMSFMWKFINGETAIAFYSGHATILLLNNERLVISTSTISGGQSARYIETFIH